jgi:hypothetical protein
MKEALKAELFPDIQRNPDSIAPHSNTISDLQRRIQHLAHSAGLNSKSNDLIMKGVPIIYLFSQIDPSSRLCKFKSVLIGYDFAIKYVKEQHNVVADALSRITIQELVELNNELSEATILVVTLKRRKKKLQK